MKTRDRIIHSATELFNDQGERNITTNHIAAHWASARATLLPLQKQRRHHPLHLRSVRPPPERQLHPIRSSEIRLEDLMGYLDAIFYLMWQFRFFYANLPDILSRDELLQQKYLKAQEQLRATVETLLRSLREGGIIAVSDEDLPDLGQTIKMVVTCWIPFQIAQAPTPASPNPCSIRRLAGAVPAAPLCAAPGGRQIHQLEQHYHQLAQPAG
jgi:hypothetical protein